KPLALDFQGEDKGEYVHWLGKGEPDRHEWGFRFYRRDSERPNRLSAYVWNAKGGRGAGADVESKEVGLRKGRWGRRVATYDDPKKPDPRVQLYANGVPSEHNASPGTLYDGYQVKPAHGPAPLRLGTRDQRGFLNGCLADVAVYPRVLPAREVLAHYQA